MPPFKMQERDLDLFLLEELHADRGFADWLARKVGLDCHHFIAAEHSVYTKLAGRWGETDVLAIFESSGERVAVMIEDKINAAFTDRQAERYHERAAELLRREQAHRYVTVLIAPKSYLSGVPKDDPWHFRLSVEEIMAWFQEQSGAHAKWRADALAGCLVAATRSGPSSGKDPESLHFAQEFAEFLKASYPEFQHHATGDRWGLIIDFRGRPKGVQLAWKLNQDFVDLTFSGEQLGKLKMLPEQAGLLTRFKSASLNSDILRAPVGTANWSLRLADQMEVVNEVIAACQRLRSLAFEITAMP